MEEMNRRQYGMITYITCTYFWIYALICVIIIIAAELSKNKEPCGINVIFWVEIFWIIILVRSVLVLQIVWIVRCEVSPVFIFIYYGVVYVLALIVAVAWLIYGYTIYFSPENDCQSNHEQFGWLVFMVILLFFGFFTICMLAILICIGICVLCLLDKLFPPQA